MRKFYIILSVVTFLTAILLRIFTDVDSDRIVLLLFPLFLLFTYYKDTLKKSMYRGIFSIIIVYSLWGHFTIESLVFSVAGASLFFGTLLLLKKIAPIYFRCDTRKCEG